MIPLTTMKYETLQTIVVFNTTEIQDLISSQWFRGIVE